MKILSTLALISLPCLATAQSCDPSTDADIPLFEEAKTAFLQSDFRGFSTLVDDYVPNMDDQFDALFGPLIDAFSPQGFDRCQTILQRRESPSLMQEIVFFFPKGSETPLALHLVGAEVDGDMRMLEFTYNTAISAVLDRLH